MLWVVGHWEDPATWYLLVRSQWHTPPDPVHQMHLRVQRSFEPSLPQLRVQWRLELILVLQHDVREHPGLEELLETSFPSHLNFHVRSIALRAVVVLGHVQSLRVVPQKPVPDSGHVHAHLPHLRQPLNCPTRVPHAPDVSFVLFLPALPSSTLPSPA